MNAQILKSINLKLIYSQVIADTLKVSSKGIKSITTVENYLQLAN